MIRLLPISLVACICWLGASSDTARATSIPVGGVVVVGEIPTTTARPGDTTVVVIPVKIAMGFHVQANPASGEFLIPLELMLELEAPDTLLSWRPVYPAPGTFRLEGTTDDLLTYHGSIGVEVVIQASAEARVGERLFKGTLRYQACDNKRCLFPATVPVSFMLVLSKDSASE